MRKRALLRVLPVLLVIVGGVLLRMWPIPVETNESDLAATVISKNPTEPRLRLKNISDHECQVATTAVGTVAVTSVTQHGKTIQPLPIDFGGHEDLGYLLQDQLQTLKPGQSADISLAVYKLSSGHIFRATTWSSDGGSFSAEYPIDNTGPLQLDLSYSLPITPAIGAPACGAIFANTADGGDIWYGWVAGGGMLVLLVVTTVFLAWRFWRKHPRHGGKAPTAAILLLLCLGVTWYRMPVVQADVIVPPELRSVYDGCIATFNANSDITGPVLNILNDPANHFEIVHTHGRGSDMTGRRDPSGTGGIFRIYWNPDDNHAYAGTGGSPDACSVLYHELYHALDQLNGTFSRDDCAGSGIETKEVMATRAQNALRVRLGLPSRSHYGDRPLPSGDCSAPSTTPTSCTGERCGDTNGDPHLRTFDGLRYDFQAAGEFIVARNQSGSFEIQARQQPWTNSKVVSVNTAVAFRVGGDRVEIRAGQTMVLLVNGKIKPLATMKLADDARLDVDQGNVVITWKDDSIAYVRSVGSYGLVLSVQASESLGGKLEGLLGDANGESKNDLHVRGDDKTIEPDFDQLYPKFADSWRITDKDSLFTYDRGKDTDSYTLRNFPEKPVNAQSLPGYAAAEAFCKNMGVSDPAVLANCALDMAITGRPEFARAALRSQIFTAGANFGGTTWQLVIKNPGDSASVTFDATAGEKIFVHIPGTNLPSQCGSLSLLGPDQKEVTNGCIINGKGAIDGTVLPATGQYTISLEPRDSAGTATVRLLRITDKQDTITPDGDSTSVRIDQPGVVGRFTFAGQTGQRVYVHVPSSTLDSQCGILRLLGPDGHEVTNGCIINHVGNIDTAVLPSTGQYTIVVDPNDVTIGQARLRLILPTAETRPISMNGPILSVSLKKPGSIATLTFNGTAGQRVYVDLPTSELPSQCGLLVLRAPDGSSVGSGCVINHKGNLTDDGVVLPASGPYAIILDPNDTNTGTTTIRLRNR